MARTREVLAHAVAVAKKHGAGKRALSGFDRVHYAHAKIAKRPLLPLDGCLRATDTETMP